MKQHHVRISQQFLKLFQGRRAEPSTDYFTGAGDGLPNHSKPFAPDCDGLLQAALAADSWHRLLFIVPGPIISWSCLSC